MIMFFGHNWCHSSLGFFQFKHWITLFKFKVLEGKLTILNIIFVSQNCFAHSNLYRLIYDINYIIARSYMY